MAITDYGKAISPGFTLGVGTLGATPPAAAEAGVGDRYQYSAWAVLAMLVDGAAAGVQMRFPGKGDPSGLPYCGADRVMPRGIAESDAAYAARLQTPFSTHKWDGTARGVMLAIAGYLTGYAPEMRSVRATTQGTSINDWDVIASGAAIGTVPTHTRVTPANWNWDGLSPYPTSNASPGSYWSRRWLIIQGTGSGGTWAGAGPLCGAGNLCGDATISCGFAQSVGRFQDILALVASRKSAGCTWEVIVSFDAALFPPAGAAGSGFLPDGKWAEFYKASSGASALSRFTSARYLGSVT